MKTKHFLLAAIVGLGATGSMFAVEAAKEAAVEAAKEDAKIQVNFTKPEKFTDVRDGFTSSQKGEESNLLQIRDYVEQQAGRFVPDGYRLAVTITNVDLAGDFEPWHQLGSNDVRIVKDIYPPRIDLTYTLTDASGKVVSEGKRELRDLAFMMKLSIRRDDPFRHEKELLDDWLRRDIKSSLAKK